MPDGLTFHDAELFLRSQPASAMPVVSGDTTLAEAAQQLAACGWDHLLVSDESGHPLGVLAREEIFQALAAASRATRNPRELVETVPDSAGSLLRVLFPVGAERSLDSPAPDLRAKPSLACGLVLKSGRLSALFLEDDVLVSGRMLRTVLEAASFDPVTGLMNRKAFESHLDREWARSLRTPAPLTLIMADGDEFKEINDRCGHGAGDRVLHAIGTALKDSLRQYDLVARFGGDEFIALCSNCPAEAAGLLASRLRQAMNRIDVPKGSERSRISLSLGFASVTSDFTRTSAAQLIAAADQCLLRAKATGRDRAFRCVLDEPEASEPRVVM